MSEILSPTMVFWENGNTWYGSKWQTRFFIRPVPAEEERPARLEAELWRGPLTLSLIHICGKSHCHRTVRCGQTAVRSRRSRAAAEWKRRIEG